MLRSTVPLYTPGTVHTVRLVQDFIAMESFLKSFRNVKDSRDPSPEIKAGGQVVAL